MAIVVSEVWPADGEANVIAGQRPRFRIADDTPADLTTSLIELILDGTSYSGADLLIYQVTDISGGSVVANTESVLVELAAGVQWYPGESVEVTYDIDYNSINESSTTFTTHHSGGPSSGGSDPLLSSLDVVSGLMAYNEPINEGADAAGAVFGTRDQITYPVDGLVRAQFFAKYDAYGYIAEQLFNAIHGSTIVADPHVERFHGSTIVRGDKLHEFLGSTVVQGPVRQQTLGSCVVGVRVYNEYHGSAIVGVEVLDYIHGSVIVRGIGRGPTIDIEVRDPTTIAALQALGVTFS